MSSSSQQIFFTTSSDGPITAYDASSTTAIARFITSRSPRRGLAVAGNKSNTFIAVSHVSSASPSGSIHLYNWHSSTFLHSIPLPEPVAPLAATSDGFFLFAGGLSGHIHVLSIPSGDLLSSFPAHKKPVSCLNISQDGSVLISGGDDGTIAILPIFQLVEMSSGDENPSSDFMSMKFVAHDDSVTHIISSMSTFVSSSMDSTCKLWSLFNGTHLQTVSFPCGILGLDLDPTETQFYAAGFDGSIYKGWVKFGRKAERSHEWIMLGQKHSSTVVSVVMTNEGKNMVSASEDGSLFVWDIESGEVIRVLGNDMGGISDMVMANGKAHGLNMGKEGSHDLGLSALVLSRRLRDSLEMEEVLMGAAKDRRRAIEMLESAITMYQKLLELILKEVKGGNCSNTDKEKDEKDKDDM
ncbi:protein ROOT INITIATION DEFECTIVE 3-like [Carica papaya]|uniref:protein ROOT INITIATION DEFECTIVE 3-like n=1 Tax=Carica papaya TaxID=3649 RepID=UPI000B8CC4B4|nr:protein ROOT INITIATION DEFECTIVE 3-like [Carica papaya]